MHSEILSKEQTELFPLLRSAKKKGFFLVGGTAIALHIGHRTSIDFDLFRFEEFSPESVERTVRNAGFHWQKRHISNDENCTGVIHSVKVTFFAYPFEISATENFENLISLPPLKTLAAMKAYAMGRRAKWKDYVDMAFVLRDHFSIEEVSSEARKIFGGAFNEAIFREQLHYFGDIDYSETIDYLIPHPPSDDEVREFLREASVS